MKKFIILLISMSALISCSKSKTTKPNPDPVYYPFPAEGLSYIQLPVNHYYIYQDSATAVEDSVVVVNSSLEKIYVPAVTGGFLCSECHDAYYVQVYTLEMKVENILPTGDWFSGSATSGGSGIFSLDTHHNSLVYGVFIYPTNGRSISSMVVLGNTYTDIEMFEFDFPSGSTESISGVYYWAKGVGIIKRQVKTADTIKTESLIRHG